MQAIVGSLLNLSQSYRFSGVLSGHLFLYNPDGLFYGKQQFFFRGHPSKTETYTAFDLCINQPHGF